MNRCFLIHSLAAGGAERWVATMANHWATRDAGPGASVTIITMAPPAQDFYALHPAVRRISLGHDTVSAGLGGAVAKNLARLRALRRALQEAMPQGLPGTVQAGMVVAVMPESSCLLALAALTWPSRTSRTSRTWVAIGAERSHPPLNPLGRARSLARAVLYGRLDAVACQTRPSADWILRHTLARRAPVIPNPVIWPLPRQAPLLDPTPAFPEQKTLLTVGRLAPEKGFDRLLQAFAGLAPRHPQWRLVILGEGPGRAGLEAQRQALRLQDRVSLPGLAGNVGDWYAAADVFVLTSRYEGFPNTLLEALAAGLPAVSVDCDTGPREILRHGVDGLLVPQDDSPGPGNGPENGLAAALDRMMADDALRRACAARAVEVRDRFALPHIAAQWDALVTELAARRRP